MAAWTEADGVALVVPIYYDAEIYANGAASNTTYFSDGVHPTQAGATLIASGLTALDDLIENLP
jgi:phospholipase/lecithinase/hemolysin